jgi:hypothetical protein
MARRGVLRRAIFLDDFVAFARLWKREGRMSWAFVTQLIGSAIAVAVLIALIGWARLARPCSPLDEDRARALLAEEFPGAAIDRLWIAADYRGAIAKSAEIALIVTQVGDGYLARSIPWTRLSSASLEGDFARLGLDDITAPRIVFALAETSPWSAAREEAS